jgi:hypothetical protein
MSPFRADDSRPFPYADGRNKLMDTVKLNGSTFRIHDILGENSALRNSALIDKF